MGDGCSVCYGVRDKEAKLYSPIRFDNDECEYTPEPKSICTDDEKVTLDPKRFIKDERSNNLEDKVSETKISETATPANGKSKHVHFLEDDKKSSSSELQRKDTNVLVSFALQKDNFIPSSLYSEVNERKMIIEDEDEPEEKLDTLPPVSKSNDPKKGPHIKTDDELIHQMLYSSDSSDSFDCHYEEKNANRL